MPKRNGTPPGSNFHPPGDKAAMRGQIAAALAGLPATLRARHSAEICRHLAGFEPWRRARTVLVFHPLADEPSLAALWAATAAGDPKRICLPRVDGPGLAIHQVGCLDDLIPGRWGVLEPDPACCPQVAPGEIEFAAVPGRAFTAGGCRLGRGRGYYDRFLPLLAGGAATVGIAFSLQIVPALPAGPHDVPVAWLATENGIASAAG